MSKEGWNVVWSWKKLHKNRSFPPPPFLQEEEEEEINTMTGHVGSDDRLWRRRRGWLVSVQPQLTAGKQGEEQRGGDGGGEVQLHVSSSSLYLSLHLTRRVLQSAGNRWRDNT